MAQVTRAICFPCSPKRTSALEQTSDNHPNITRQLCALALASAYTGVRPLPRDPGVNLDCEELKPWSRTQRRRSSLRRNSGRNTDTHRHADTQTRHRHRHRHRHRQTQTHTNTHRHTQTHTDTHRHRHTTKTVQTHMERDILNAKNTRTALPVGLAGNQIRISGSVSKSENGQKQGLESVSQGVWHCVAQHFENVAQRSVRLPGRLIIRLVSEHLLISRPTHKS
jgi:hypothetical protein